MSWGFRARNRLSEESNSHSLCKLGLWQPFWVKAPRHPSAAMLCRSSKDLGDQYGNGRWTLENLVPEHEMTCSASSACSSRSGPCSRPPPRRRASCIPSSRASSVGSTTRFARVAAQSCSRSTNARCAGGDVEAFGIRPTRGCVTSSSRRRSRVGAEPRYPAAWRKNTSRTTRRRPNGTLFKVARALGRSSACSRRPCLLRQRPGRRRPSTSPPAVGVGGICGLLGGGVSVS